MHIRPGASRGTTIANVPRSKLNDLNALILVDGPYLSPAKAHAAAQSLQGIEYAASGGVWEVTASLRGRRGYIVVAVANCLAGHGSVRPTTGKKLKF